MADLMFYENMNFWIIVVGAIVTYFTRTAGHLILSRFETIHPRVEAGLNAVPVAVITAIVMPAIITGGIAELITIFIAVIASLRLSLIHVFFISWIAIVALRYFGF